MTNGVLDEWLQQHRRELRARDVRGDIPCDHEAFAQAYAVTGNKAESNRIVAEVTSQSGPFSPYDMATICAAWHDTNEALHWLEKAIEQRSVDVIWIRVDPRLDNIRDEPGFREVLARMVPRLQFSQAPK